jgi:HlyD family secretion protein
VAQADIARAEARLRPTAVESGAGPIAIRSPVTGVVLNRARQSEGVVPAGEVLLEVGDPSQLEIVADLLSTDAVQVKHGDRAIVAEWGGSEPLEARVRRVEPSAFTKISALGVEEQRVNVILDFIDPAAAWQALGDAYRVETRIVLWEAPDVLKVPIGTLFRRGTDWAVYTVADGRARLTPVQIGQQTGQDAEVLSGLTDGARVILHPGDTIVDGVRVEERTLGES